MASALRVPAAEIYAIDLSSYALRDKREFDLNLQPITFVLSLGSAIACAPQAVGRAGKDGPPHDVMGEMGCVPERGVEV